MNKSGIEDKVRTIAEPIAVSLGLTLWDVRFDREGHDYFLRIYIDKAEHVSIDDCVAMSQAMDKPLDEADPIEESYSLQVSSPGVERKLTRPEHFTWAEGRKVMVKLHGPSSSGGVVKGELISSDGNAIKVDVSGEEKVLDSADIIWVKLDDFDE